MRLIERNNGMAQKVSLGHDASQGFVPSSIKLRLAALNCYVATAPATQPRNMKNILKQNANSQNMFEQKASYRFVLRKHIFEETNFNIQVRS